jgi:hypothetical protein
MKTPIEQPTERSNGWLQRDEKSTRSQESLSFCQKESRARKVMQNVKHHDVIETPIRKRQRLCVGDRIEPSRGQDVGRDDM